MYLLTHSLVLVLVAVMKPKVLKTKISHADPPTLSLILSRRQDLSCSFSDSLSLYLCLSICARILSIKPFHLAEVRVHIQQHLNNTF